MAMGWTDFEGSIDVYLPTNKVIIEFSPMALIFFLYFLMSQDIFEMLYIANLLIIWTNEITKG